MKCDEENEDGEVTYGLRYTKISLKRLITSQIMLLVASTIMCGTLPMTTSEILSQMHDKLPGQWLGHIDRNDLTSRSISAYVLRLESAYSHIPCTNSVTPGKCIDINPA